MCGEMDALKVLLVAVVVFQISLQKNCQYINQTQENTECKIDRNPLPYAEHPCRTDQNNISISDSVQKTELANVSTTNTSVSFSAHSLDPTINVTLKWREDFQVDVMYYKEVAPSSNGVEIFPVFNNHILHLFSSKGINCFNLTQVFYVTWVDEDDKERLLQTVLLTENGDRSQAYVMVFYESRDDYISGSLEVSLSTGFANEPFEKNITHSRDEVYFFNITTDSIEELTEDCGPPCPPINGQVDYNTTTLGSVANYTCNGECSLVNHNSKTFTRTCTKGGEWSEEIPLCPDVRCDISIASIPNGQPWISTIDGLGVIYKCDSGYKIDGSNAITCKCDSEIDAGAEMNFENLHSDMSFSRHLVIGAWSGATPRCLNIDECAEGIDDCSENATCTDTEGSYVCICHEEYTREGMNCTDFYECAQDTHNCSEDETCSNTYGSSICNCTIDIRVVKGNKTHGLIEVCHEGKWRSVCDDYWTDTDANVACGQLGHLPYGASATLRGMFNSSEPISYWLDDVRCGGDEDSLFNCRHRKTHNCRRKERAGVHCLIKNDIGIRLVNDSIVEISIRGEWRSVCDNHWTNEDAQVACGQLLGLPYHDARVVIGGEFEPGEEKKYWLDNVRCQGHEESLLACAHLGIGRHNCGQGQRAGVSCEAQ